MDEEDAKPVPGWMRSGAKKPAPVWRWAVSISIALTITANQMCTDSAKAFLPMYLDEHGLVAYASWNSFMVGG